MEIVVQGIAKKSYKPDELEIQIEFLRREKTYDEALESGTKDVEEFIEKVMKKLKLSVEDLKTQVFRIYEETKVDYEREKEFKLGFVYEQRAILRIDYSIEKMMSFIESLTELENTPKCNLKFSIKDEESKKQEVISAAFANARRRAVAIADADHRIIKKCIKTDFKPYGSSIGYNQTIDAASFMGDDATPLIASREDRMAKIRAELPIIITPEEIIVQETIYCTWLAE